MVDFKLEDLDIGSSFNLDDLDLSKPKSQYSRLPDLDLDLNSNNPTLESDIESKTNLEDMIPVSETQNHINNT